MPNVTLLDKVVLTYTHEGFYYWSMLQGHFARVSRHEGVFSSLFNLPRDLAPKYVKPSTHKGFCSWSMLPGPGGGGGVGYSQKNWVGVCGPLPKTLTPFMTKIDNFPYPIYDLTKNLIPYLWPDPKINTLFQNHLIIISLVQTSVKGNVYLLLLGRLQDCLCKKQIQD